MTELAKTFEPGPIEARWYAHWEGEGLFRPEREDAVPYTIVMPPPNVTGSLHIGHALDNTLQDVLIRRARMDGKDALWVVGTDHAGIATQMVVERQLDLQQKKRTDFTRDEFVDRVWAWKHESGGQITGQLRRLGASCDWANERFTMDEGFSAAVLKVFVELYKRKLLYRDKRLVNWDPHFQTAISDLEVETRDTAGKFWTLRYPLEDGSGHIEVATTRPETMLADMAVAVHPDDARYAAMIGKKLKQPITGRLIPIVTDEHADPELGSGAVKITPGHDFNDFEVGKRAGFKPAEMLNMLDAHGRVTQTADGLIPADLVGMDRFDARKKVVELLDAAGALVKVEDRTIATPYGDRSGVVIEPWLTDQWYVDAETLSKPAIEAVRSGEIAVVPETWKKTWFNWLENIQPWCVSRQLWWGHRIPAWYGPARASENLDDDIGFSKVFVAETEDGALRQAREYYGDEWDVRATDSLQEALDWLLSGPPAGKMFIYRDADVLDTWFSSALWPFATLGWPEQTHDLARHYPNDVLISGFDIIFFWDARMAMQGFEFMGERPWKTLYLHGLVRDDKGAKMSKSKGNVVDPLGLIDKYGADALRFTLAAMESQGRDIKLDEKRVEGYRNFATKLWNAARFLQGNGVGASQSIAAPEAKLPVNRWIIGEVVETLGRLNKAFDELRFDGMADAIYHFTWGTFCDWYLEFIKPLPTPEEIAKLRNEGVVDERWEETRLVASWVFDQILVMLHPFMPFVTEELWHSMGKRPNDLIVAKWPSPGASVDLDAKSHMEWLKNLVGDVRAARTAVNVPPSATLKAWIYNLTPEIQRYLDQSLGILVRMGRMRGFSNISAPNQNGLQVPAGEATFFLEVSDVIDLDAERSRLKKAVEAAEKERDSLAARLGNPSFTERAKPEAIEKARADHDARAAEAERLSAALARLG